MGSHWRALNESFPMNTNMTEFRLFLKNHPWALDESSLSIGSVYGVWYLFGSKGVNTDG